MKIDRNRLDCADVNIVCTDGCKYSVPVLVQKLPAIFIRICCAIAVSISRDDINTLFVDTIARDGCPAIGNRGVIQLCDPIKQLIILIRDLNLRTAGTCGGLSGKGHYVLINDGCAQEGQPCAIPTILLPVDELVIGSARIGRRVGHVFSERLAMVYKFNCVKSKVCSICILRVIEVDNMEAVIIQFNDIVRIGSGFRPL